MKGRRAWIRLALYVGMVLAVHLVSAWERMGARESVASMARDPTEWPFDVRSPWNYPIGSTAEYVKLVSQRWDISTGGYANIERYSIPTYVATLSDPLRAVFDRYKRTGTSPVVIRLRIPDVARPAQGTDGHLNVIDETEGIVHEFYRARRTAGGDLETFGLVRNDLYGPGGGFRGWHGTVAAGTSSLGGVIRKGELTTGTAALGSGIRHALQGVAPKDALNRNAPGAGACPGSLCRPFVWPASSADTPALRGEGYDTVGNAYMGSLLAIPRWIDIRRLGIVDPQAFEVARALQDYGVYIVDQGSTGGRLVIRIDPQAVGEIGNRDAFAYGLNLAIRALMIVSNSHTRGLAPLTPGGGGTPRRPLAPPLR